MKAIKPLVVLMLGLVFSQAHAAGLALSKSDCMDILERWAADPASVPRHLVDSCKEMMGAGTAAATGQPAPNIKPAAGQPAIASVDPCSGPDASSSVHCWGPWGFLAPAAGGVAPVALAKIDEFDPRPELADAFDPRLTTPNTPPPPLGSCSPGAACGFATLVPGTASQSQGTPSAIVPFQMQTDGSEFVVDPGGQTEIISNSPLDPTIGPGPDRFEKTVNGVESKLIAETKRDSRGNIVEALGAWDHNDLVSTDPAKTNSGSFVWGVATSQARLDELNNGGRGISMNFSGRMTGDPQTRANMTVNFGTQPNWRGNWNNAQKGVQFDAGGSVTGVNLVSDPTKFSTNVQGSRSFVQGVLLGERGDQSVAHAIDVTLTSGESLKSVGVLRQVGGETSQ